MMDSLQWAFNRFRPFFRKKQLDQDLDTALATHLDLVREENIHGGMPSSILLERGGVRSSGATLED